MMSDLRADRKRRKPGEGMATVFAALLVFSLIEAFAGRSAASWFGGGFIVSALVAMWEAGRNTPGGQDV
jgi:drug/metabolite transporter superfamily protein YnfA